MARVVQWWLFLALAFYVACLLSIIPLHGAYQWCRPQWVLMLVIFCQLVQPNLFNPCWAWLMGLLVDGLLQTTPGEHALIFALISYLTALVRPRFLLRPMWQQVGKVFLLIGLGQILMLWFHMFAGQNPRTLLYWMGTLTSCLIWPIYLMVLHYLGRFFNVSALPARTL